jgi:hypothetical protein
MTSDIRVDILVDRNIQHITISRWRTMSGALSAEISNSLMWNQATS